MNAYQKALSLLNSDQLTAVETIEGPVMVLAGPGSGKTQVLGTRIGYILENTDTPPQNILCLTFTDAGVVAMRERLINFIGKEAFKVNIHTFHSFCNLVIQENPAEFSQKFEVSVASDLQKIEILREMIDKIPMDDVNKRLTGNIYYEIPMYQNLFSEMKRENLSPSDIENQCNDFLSRLETFDDMIYKKKGPGYEKGDRKEKEFIKYKSYTEKLISAAHKIEDYNKLLSKAGLYDYDDMINWVVNAFDKNEDLLLDYQEQFLYLLVDEFQDTNGIQMKLLNQLCSFWEENPNVFVVGDDDQAIYRFQGANVENLNQFYVKYNPKVICLSTNYRSRPAVLYAASELISNNITRLGNTIPGVQKGLTAFKDQEHHDKPKVQVYSNAEQEDTAIIKWIEDLIKTDTKPNKIAVICRHHIDLSNLVSVCQKKHIPVFVKTKINALYIPIVRNLITIMRYLDSYINDPLNASIFLIELIQYPSMGIKSFDVVKLVNYFNEKNRNSANASRIDIREIMSSSQLLATTGISNPNPMLELADKIENWIGMVQTETLQVLFENVLVQSKILEYVLNSPNKINLLESIHVIFNFIKDESSKKPSFSLSEAIGILDKMEDYKIELPFVKVIGNSDGVQMMTAHGTKGLEYEHVWLKGADSKKWESSPAKNKSFFFSNFHAILRNPGLQNLKSATDINKEIKKEDERRLFFVAVTRAEDELVMSYSPKTSDKKETPSQFLTEIFGDIGFETKEVSNEDLAEHLINTMRPSDLNKDDFDKDYLNRILENYKLSSTALNNFLSCPLKFYYSNIMRIPQARSANMGFGSAVHKVLERLWRNRKDKGSWPDEQTLDALIEKYFVESMEEFHSHFNKNERENYLAQGRKILPKFIKQQVQKWSEVPDFKTEYKVTTLLDNKIPLTGNIDRIDIFNDHLHVTDYKTGKYSNAADKLKLPEETKNQQGGDYWRQIVFYKILLDLDNGFTKQMTSGSMDFIEPGVNDALQIKKFVVSPSEIEVVKDQISSTYEKIINHEFHKGCGKKDCHYCDLVKNFNSLELIKEDDAQEEGDFNNEGGENRE